MPPLLVLATDAEYRQNFEGTYCRGVITTHDGIRVYFKKEDFDHSFFESTLRKGVKDTTLSQVRAQRMGWIAATLADPAAVRFQGWDKKNGRYDPTRCVSVVFGDFVVVIRLGKKADGTLKANFVTCYLADNSIGKIRQSPLWNREDCLNAL
ncbi:hypothetical protein [Phyllobacterium zundukense]|uniref:Uncharacterized protein n=1 Tax=Phyllobacterium zundukense TaxID=1867719 RepID=A0ACD4CV84_9HYPH|nr:hypothetical protein [Phyllobacterium zundukense]UXN57463.1 hypothetical protein N8E88_03750 [Phyllobacterium zundukense]